MLHRLLIALMIIPMSTAYAQLTAAQQLTQLLQPVRHFSADFEQTITSPTGKMISRSKGLLKISRPGQFYWEVFKPNAVRIISDGRSLWTYDIELEQIIKQKAKTAIVGSPASLLAGEWVSLEKDFTVKYADKKHTAYVLSPRDADSLFHDIKLSFKQNQLSSMDIQDKLGHHTTIQFSQAKINTPLDPQLFNFHPPKGVDLIIQES